MHQTHRFLSAHSNGVDPTSTYGADNDSEIAESPTQQLFESNGDMTCACQCSASYTAATSSQNSGDDTAAIVGSSVGAVAFVGAIAGVIYLKTRKPAEDQGLHVVLVEDEVGL